MGIEEVAWDATTFTRNRQRLIDADAGRALMSAVLSQARQQKLLSDEHFRVDGTLIEAWASQNSFQSKDGDPPADGGGDFRGQRRTNHIHASITDPQARSYRNAPGQEARLAYLGHALMDNRYGLVVDACATQATGEIKGVFGWLKRIGGLRKVKLRGVAKVDSLFTLALAAYSLVRMRTLLMPQPQSVEARQSAPDRRHTAAIAQEHRPLSSINPKIARLSQQTHNGCNGKMNELSATQQRQRASKRLARRRGGISIRLDWGCYASIVLASVDPDERQHSTCSLELTRSHGQVVA